jgi:hypothetical protein
MRNIHFGIISVLLVFVGCVPSLHELYTEETLVFDPSIAGQWQQKNEDAVWEFKPDKKNKSYDLTIIEEKDKKSRLKAHLVNLNGKRFFDFYPGDDVELDTGDWVKASLIPGHLFLRIDQTEPNLVLAAMNPDTINKLLEKKPELIKHEQIHDGDSIVLTDKPKQLQAFVTAGLEIEDFFGDPMILERAKPAEPNKP